MQCKKIPPIYMRPWRDHPTTCVRLATCASGSLTRPTVDTGVRVGQTDAAQPSSYWDPSQGPGDSERKEPL